MSFTAQDVKALRERTGCGVMDCKRALVSANGDMEKAVVALREKGLAAAVKKSGRIAAEGAVYAEVDPAKKVGVILEVNSETDFVAKTDRFRELVKLCADTILESAPADVETLLKTKAVGSDRTVEEQVHDRVLVMGENIRVRRFRRLTGDLVCYIHGGGRIGTLVKFETDAAGKEGFAEYAKNIAMQVAAANPQYLDRGSVPADVLAEEKKVLTAQAISEGKPEKIAEKIVMGRLNKYYQEVCLVDQEYIKDSDLSVAKYTQQQAKALGGSIKIVEFVRYERGEGLQKRVDNLAEEVAGMVH